MTVSAFRSMACALAAAIASTASAQEAKPADASKPAELRVADAKPAEAKPESKPTFKFEFHGFIGGSISGMDAVANGYGGAISYVTAAPSEDRFSFTGDVRQTRLNLSIAGPKVLGANPKGVAEMDFSSGQASGQFALEQPAPRLRLAYAELSWDGGAHILRFGQDTDLIQGGIAPASVGHISTNLAYTNGYIGFRHPGVFFYETIPVVDGYKVELAMSVTKGQWDDQASSATVAGSDPNGSGQSFAEASGLPAIEARAKLKSKIVEAYIGGHWNRIDFSGVGVSQSPATPCAPGSATNPLGGESGCRDRDVAVGNVGIKITYAGATVQGSGYYGKNAGALNGGAIGQRQAPQADDLQSYGLWGQVGYNFTPELSAWYLIGTERFVNYAKVVRALGNSARLTNMTQSGMIRWQQNGYAVGLEYAHFRTKVASTAGTISARRSPDGILHGNQLMLAGFYFF